MLVSDFDRKLVEVKVNYDYFIGYSSNLNDVLIHIEQVKKQIPEEFVDSAILIIDDQSYEKGDYVYYLRVSYFRTETDAEYEKRIKACKKISADKKLLTEEKERKELARLKEKYES